MAAGLSSKQIYNRAYSRLNQFASELRHQGWKAEYVKWTVHASLGEDREVSAWYSVGHMSNGETYGEFKVTLNGKQVQISGDFPQIVRHLQELPFDFQPVKFNGVIYELTPADLEKHARRAGPGYCTCNRCFVCAAREVYLRIKKGA